MVLKYFCLLSVLLYADDTQIYVSLKPSSKEDIKIRFEVCLSDLRTWFVANKLCCNSSKTNFIYFTPLSRLPSPSLYPIWFFYIISSGCST